MKNYIGIDCGKNGGLAGASCTSPRNSVSRGIASGRWPESAENAEKSDFSLDIKNNIINFVMLI